MLDNWGGKPSDSENELSLRTFSVMNETDGLIVMGVALLLGMYRDGVDRTMDMGMSIEGQLLVLRIVVERTVWTVGLESVRLHRRKMSFHQALNLIFELDEAARARSYNNDQDSLAFRSRSLPSADWSMVHLVTGVTCSSPWKELSKETSSKILPCGDGSY
ncbi:hypothetical protein Tco_0167635 [Tanacetum coccineum]